MSFAAWMRETRMKKGLTTSECALRGGVSQPAWSEWEQAGPEKEWRKATIYKIAAGLDVERDKALLAARQLPTEGPDMEAGRRLGPILARASPANREAILDAVAEFTERMVTIVAA